MKSEKEKIIIGNCSGFYGDRLSAAKDMVEGGPIDVLTGDYLAELTMTILYNQRMKRGEDQGYVGTFLKQFTEIAKACEENKPCCAPQGVMPITACHLLSTLIC